MLVIEFNKGISKYSVLFYCILFFFLVSRRDPSEKDLQLNSKKPVAIWRTPALWIWHHWLNCPLNLQIIIIKRGHHSKCHAYSTTSSGRAGANSKFKCSLGEGDYWEPPGVWDNPIHPALAPALNNGSLAWGPLRTQPRIQTPPLGPVMVLGSPPGFSPRTDMWGSGI